MKKGIVLKTSKQHKLKRLSIIFESSGDSFSFSDIAKLKDLEFDFFFQHGIKKPARQNNDVFEFVENYGKPILIKEAPPIRELQISSSIKSPIEDQWMRLSWNSFFMDDGIHPYDPSYDRWDYLQKTYNLRIEDWKRRGNYILFNLQEIEDSSLNRLHYNNIDYKKYCIDIINEIKAHTDKPILIRPHPKDTLLAKWLKQQNLNVEFSDMRPFKEDLNRAWCLVTYNSTTCVESTLYGTPTIVLDSSAVSWEVSQQSISNIENKHDIDRSLWLKKIAFMQWKGTELKNGYAWALLKSLIWN